MNQATFSRLMELSSLPDAEREAAIDKAQPREIKDYLLALESLTQMQVQQPVTSKKWAGRTQLLNEVAAYHQKPAPWFSLSRLHGLRGATVAAAAGAVLLGSVAVLSSLTGLSGSDGTFSEVLSALGLRTQEQVEPPVVAPELPRNVPESVPEFAPPVIVPTENVDEPSNIQEDDILDPTSQPEQPSALPPGQVLDPPGQGGENPGQGVDPPGQGGENPSQGVDPPGQGGENPGQGVDPPGQGGENPGQGVDPPGQSGENPGQGSDPPGQGSGNENGNGGGNGNGNGH